MAVYSVEGKLGTGKTKFAVYQAEQAMLAGRRVASNVDLKPELLNPWKACTYVRLPDKPTAEDFLAAGHGNPETYDENRNGVLILDELGTWLNSRSFQDKSRAGVIDWLIHARKYGWDVFLIVQDATMIDKQVREALIEYQCRCMNLSRVRIPFIGKLLGFMHKPWGYLPKMHTVTARTGYGQNAIIAEKWLYRGDHLHAAYDTRQIFTSDYTHGPHSVLVPWDFERRKTSGEIFRERLETFLGRFRAPPLVRPAPRQPGRAITLLRDVDMDPDRKMELARRYWQGQDWT